MSLAVTTVVRATKQSVQMKVFTKRSRFDVDIVYAGDGKIYQGLCHRLED